MSNGNDSDDKEKKKKAGDWSIIIKSRDKKKPGDSKWFKSWIKVDQFSEINR